jgi:hypothetical protein
MAAQQRSISPDGDDPSRIRAQAHDPGVYLARLLVIAALTAIVVAVWAIADDPPPSVALPATQVVEANITAPPAEIRDPTAAVAVAPARAVTQRPEPLTPDEFISYLVQPGDVIFDIARFNGATVDDLLRFNPGLGDGTRIDVGQIIMIPVFDE